MNILTPTEQIEAIAERTDFCNALHDFASWLVRHPDVPLPAYGACFSSFVATVDKARQATHLSGRWNKEMSGNNVEYVREFSRDDVSKWSNTRVYYSLNLNREQVCKKVQVGTTTKPKIVSYARGSEEVPVYEWECTPAGNHDDSSQAR